MFSSFQPASIYGNIPSVLEQFKDAENDNNEMLSDHYWEILHNGTLNPKELFQAHPPSVHPLLWEAIYCASNDDWGDGLPSPALIEMWLRDSDLFSSSLSNLDVLRDWIGHGFGYQGVRQCAGQPAAGPGQRRRVLVPGCGRGADAVFLSKVVGYDVVGLDVSDMALNEAVALELGVVEALSEALCKTPVEKGMEQWAKLVDVATRKGLRSRINSGSLVWRYGDFLADNCCGKHDTFDLIWDNRFFSALHPSLRPRWAQKMVDLVARPQGRLLCREIPSYKDVQAGGPFYSAAPWFYHLHLTYPGNDKVVDYVRGVMDLSPETTSTGGTGLVQLARFSAKDVQEFKAGKEMLTWMSIWGPGLGGVVRQTTTRTEQQEAPQMQLQTVVRDGRRKLVLKRRQMQDDQASPSSSTSMYKSKTSPTPETAEQEGGEPDGKVAKRVRFSIP